MKKYILYLLAVIALAACSDEIPEHNQPLRAKRALLAYLVANNNLDSSIMDNVVWMYQSLAAAQDTCTLVVYYKPYHTNSLLEGAKILKYQTDGYGRINGHTALTEPELTEANVVGQAEIHNPVAGISTQPDVMEGNLRLMQELASAQSYGLIFGSHATGWMPASSGISTFSFGVDGKESNSINIPQLARTLEHSFPDGTLDFTFFDACMMGTAEVYYELRNATRYCLASVMETPVIGLPYHRFLLDLYAEDVDYTYVCDEIIAFNRSQNLWGTYAVVDCQEMENLAEAVKEELAENQEKLPELSSHSIQQYGVYRTPPSTSYLNYSFDMAEVIKKLNDDTPPSSFQYQLEKTVIAKNCIDDYTGDTFNILKNKDRYCGIGMYLPGMTGNDVWDDYYRSYISWYQAVGWNNLETDE